MKYVALFLACSACGGCVGCGGSFSAATNDGGTGGGNEGHHKPSDVVEGGSVGDAGNIAEAGNEAGEAGAPPPPPTDAGGPPPPPEDAGCTDIASTHVTWCVSGGIAAPENYCIQTVSDGLWVGTSPATCECSSTFTCACIEA